jgi:tRNA G10  N-methylase Trm11
MAHYSRKKVQVIACDIDAEQLEMAKRNCEVYGVEHKVVWHHGDIFNSQLHSVDAVFLSPPWGGPAGSDQSFDAVAQLPGLTWCADSCCSCSYCGRSRPQSSLPTVLMALPGASRIAYRWLASTCPTLPYHKAMQAMLMCQIWWCICLGQPWSAP